MKTLTTQLGGWLLNWTLFGLSLSAGFAQGTAFTYQGRLNTSNAPANGSYDMTFALFDASTGGTQQGGLSAFLAIPVSNGLFAVTMDLGNNFPGADRWLEIAVRTNSGGALATLTPRQKITATPYAITAGKAATATSFGGSLAGDVTGLQGATVVSSIGGKTAAAVASAVNDVNAATNEVVPFTLVRRDGFSSIKVFGFTAGSFNGYAGGLTGLNASQLASGTVPDARLSANVPLLNSNQTFTGASTFTSELAPNAGLRLNNSNIWFRYDNNHGVGWYGNGKPFGGSSNTIDGPVLFGYGGGALGTEQFNAEKIALLWNSSGNVGIGTNNPQSALHVVGTIIADNFMATAGPATPVGMVLIPAGAFTMGNSIGDGDISDATPISTTVSAFYMDVNLVSWSQWQSVYFWATNHGYGFVHAGAGKAANHPVQTVDWWDCVKWSNARSQQAGRPPVYYTDAAFTKVYTNGEPTTLYPNWSAKGYRLPTEAEWEKAARGGLSGQRFPWGNVINHNLANYFGNTANDSYDLGPDGYNAIGSVGGTSPATSPVGSFAANGYGLYDMTGNVNEWCWDWYGPYAGGLDPHGPAGPLTDRVLRGGHWHLSAYYARSAYRNFNVPAVASSGIGFRCVRGF